MKDGLFEDVKLTKITEVMLLNWMHVQLFQWEKNKRFLENVIFWVYNSSLIDTDNKKQIS